MKILDRYIIKTFLQPFLFIFSVIFFIFMVNVVWIQMANIVGRGLTTFELFKFFLYASPSVVSMVTSYNTFSINYDFWKFRRKV